MRDPDRINIILEELGKLWKKHPDLRLGQLLENYVFPNVIAKRCDSKGLTNSSSGVLCAALLYFQEDDVTLEKLRKINKSE
jgi:hypothetical protein